MKIKAAVLSDIGTIRNINQDNYFFYGRVNNKIKPVKGNALIFSKRKALLGLFDGMGGEQSGEIASLMAAQELQRRYDKNTTDFTSFAENYIQTANRAVCDYMDDNPDISMGTTATLLYIDAVSGKARAANVGDSKVYHIRNNTVKKISQDHNVAAELARAGMITEEEAYSHKDKNKLTQYLGIFEEDLIIEPYFSEEIDIQSGDIFVMCSDGLTDGVLPEYFSICIAEAKSPRKSARRLVQKTKLNGSRDNITVIVVKVV